MAGCSVGPDYKRPETQVPSAWLEKTSPAAWPSPDWWRGFRSPQLNTFIEEAQRTNFDLGAAMARVRQADAQIRISGAALLPTIEGTGGAERIRLPSGGGGSSSLNLQQSGTTLGSGTASGRSGSHESFNRFNVGLSASYEIDFWGKNRDFLAAAEASARATRFDAEVVYLAVVSNTATTYFQAIGLQDQLAVARNNLKTGEELLALLRGRLRAGTASELDVTQQETVVAGLRAAIPPLEQQLQQFVNALAILIGRLPEQVEVAPGTLAGLMIPAVSPGMPSELLLRRPDVQEAEAQLVAANANVKAARAAFFPSIVLTGNAGYVSTALSSLFQPESLLLSVAGSLTQPIFEGGLLEGTLEQQKARYDELVQDYRKAVISAFGDVENALVATRETAEQERLEEEAVRTARHSYEIALAQLRAGVIDMQTVLNTQSALFQAEDLLAQVRLARTQAVVQLFQALGGGWQVASS